MNEVVDELYDEISNHLGITVKEFKDRICSGERLVQYYYEWKYNWNLKDESSIPF